MCAPAYYLGLHEDDYSGALLGCKAPAETGFESACGYGSSRDVVHERAPERPGLRRDALYGVANPITQSRASKHDGALHQPRRLVLTDEGLSAVGAGYRTDLLRRGVFALWSG